MKNPALLFIILCICTNLTAQKIQILETERLIEIQDTAYILDSVIYFKYPSEVDSVCYWKYIYHRQQDGRMVYSEQFSFDVVWQSWLNENRTSYYWDSAGVDYLYINYRWSKTDQDWRPFSRVDIELDEFGATLLRHYQDWDTINNNWIDNYKRFYEYDENGNLILEGQINWSKEENIWKSGFRVEREYNDNNQQIVEARYYYDPNIPKWIGNYKNVREYNQDKLISEIYFNWVDWEDRWIEAHKIEFYYDELNRQSLMISSLYDEYSQLWYYLTKQEDIYNESDQVIMTNHYQWSDKSWTLQNQDSTIYLNSEEKNWNINLTRISNTLPWDSVERTEINFDEVSGNTETLIFEYIDSKWQIITRNIRRVDVKGSSYFEGYIWDDELQQLTGTYISETSYNDKGIYLGQTIYIWSADYNNWIGTYNASYNRYDFGLISYDTYFKWDTINSEWDIDEKGFYYYNKVIYSDNEPIIFQSDEISVYPNPARDILNVSITGEPAGINSYYIFDLTGKMITSGHLVERSAMIDVSGLKNGMYIIKVQGNKKYTAKIVIRK